jgi:hypothetical protein
MVRDLRRLKGSRDLIFKWAAGSTPAAHTLLFLHNTTGETCSILLNYFLMDERIYPSAIRCYPHHRIKNLMQAKVYHVETMTKF